MNSLPPSSSSIASTESSSSSASPAGRHIILVAGGSLGDWALPYLHQDDLYLVGADRGAWFLLQHGLTPDVALGDFDSVNDKEREEIRLRSKLFLDCDPIRKDLTDTEWALDWVLAQGPASIDMIGVTGTRFDHTLANIHLLRKAAEARIPCRIRDEHNEIQLVTCGQTLTLPNPGGSFDQVSLLPLSERASGITLTGFRYPLTEAELTIGQSLGISNIIEGSEAAIRLREGWLLVIQSRG